MIANVLDYGLPYDPQTIQRAIDGGADSIYVPGGYVFKSTLLELGEGQTLYGDGMYSSTIKLMDNCAGYVSDVGLLGITAKSGIDYCCVRDIGYDGNAINNRDWGSGWENWEDNEYDLVYTMGLYFSRLHGRIPPKAIKIQDVFIHDTVRDCIAIDNDVNAMGNNLHLRNSDADHLIYLAGNYNGTSTLSNILCEGHVRGEYIAIDGSHSLSNISFRNLTTNPTIYNGRILISSRSNSRSNISNITAIIDPNISKIQNFSIFNLFGSSNISNVHITQTGHGGHIRLVYSNSGLGNADGNNISGVIVRNAQPNMQILKNQAKEIPIRNMSFRDVHVYFTDVVDTIDSSLFEVNASQEINIDNVNIYGNVARRFISSISGVDCSNHTISNINMTRCADYFAFMESRENIRINNVSCEVAPTLKFIPPNNTNDVTVDNVYFG